MRQMESFYLYICEDGVAPPRVVREDVVRIPIPHSVALWGHAIFNLKLKLMQVRIEVRLDGSANINVKRLYLPHCSFEKKKQKKSTK